MRRESEQHLREIAAKGAGGVSLCRAPLILFPDAELGTLRTQVDELTLTLRTKEEDIAQLSQLKSEGMIRARKGGEGEVRTHSDKRGG